ncbi:MAG: 50S ribosomal protein L11 methyltransferase [Saprospiraceae bacterium]|nr:50S ribosomal protein L11 methyltransferase [Saprospiraceae bacterium]
MEVYRRFSIQTAPEWREILLAFLAEMPFDSFEDTDEGLNAYLPPGGDALETEQQLKQLQADYAFHYSVEALKNENWNAVWESNFQPVQVRDFCGIRAEFHPPFEGVQYEIVIQPKMAFGTGHHETTWMMMDQMSHLDLQGKLVFDFGCGTGILAILAAQLGATRVDGVDNEYPAYENTLEHAQRNGVGDKINAFYGSLDDVPPAAYDLILANINRNVILASMPELRKRLSENGLLLLSGILHEDEPAIMEAAVAHQFRGLAQQKRGNWMAILLG